MIMAIQRIEHGLRYHYLYEVWRHHKRRCTEESYEHYRGYPIEPEWISYPVDFIRYVESTLGERPSESHVLAFYDRSLGLVRGNLLWKLKFDVLKETSPSTGLVRSPTYSSWASIRKKGAVKRWDKFENFLLDVGIRQKHEHFYRPDPSKPFGPDNFEWIYFEGRRGDHKDYSKWWRAKLMVGMCPIWNDFIIFIQDMGDAPLAAGLKRRDLSRPHSPSNSYWEVERSTIVKRKSGHILKVKMNPMVEIDGI
jgi:hypothetical protein